jgi:hypothetical protein
MAALSSLRILTNYNNEPFVRSLTATLQWNPNDANTWVTFSSASNASLNTFNVFWGINAARYLTTPIVSAYSPTHNKVIRFGSNQQDLPDNINPIVINFSAQTYEGNGSYSLDSISLSAGINPYLNSWTTYPRVNDNVIIVANPIVYDTFPDVSGDIFINYEGTNRSNFYYRLTSAIPNSYSANINISSANFSISSALNGNTYKTFLKLNNGQILNSLNQINSFNTIRPTVCSLQLTVSANVAIDSDTGGIFNFYAPHIFALNSISAIFVNALPSADFIAYPNLYFKNAISLPTQLSASNYTSSPGLCFYGEGHTEKINLSAGVQNGITNYIWRDISKQPFLNVSNNSFNTNTNILSVASTIGSYPTIPLGLQITTSTIPSTAPLIQYSDIDGTPSYYPYYKSTVDVYGNELTTNNRFFQSVRVVPYDSVAYTFNAGFTDPVLFLPADKSPRVFTASLNVGYNSIAAIQPCYDKYGIDWKWRTFENCTTKTSQYSLPSSWTTTGSAGAYPKKWYNECNSSYTNCSAGIISPSPVGCIGSTSYWSISTANWFVPPQIINSNTLVYSFNFAEPYLPPYVGVSNIGVLNGIFPTDRIVPGVLTVTETVTCRISIPGGGWQPKVTTISAASAFQVQGAPVLRLYTPNRYVLTATDVIFQNITLNTGFLTNLTIDYGDNIYETVSGADIINNFKHRYTSIGPKTISLSGSLIYGDVTVREFPNLITVVNHHDDVIPGSYITTHTPLTPPYETAPYIAANDNAIDDNINSVFTKFYENLNYLQQRSKVYPSTTLDNFGWLGIPSTIVTDLTGYRWNDFCGLNPDVTWRTLSCDSLGLKIPVT